MLISFQVSGFYGTEEEKHTELEVTGADQETSSADQESNDQITGGRGDQAGDDDEQSTKESDERATDGRATNDRGDEGEVEGAVADEGEDIIHLWSFYAIYNLWTIYSVVFIVALIAIKVLPMAAHW